MKKKLLIKIEELYYLENYDRVIAKTNQLIKIDPDSVEGYLFRGLCFNKINRYSEAISDFSFVLQREPDHLQAKCYRNICFGKLNKIDRVLTKKLLMKISRNIQKTLI